MMFGQDRTKLRRFFLECWNKRNSGRALEPLENLVANVVAQHPEYHAMLSNDALDHDWTPEQGETNPFLHMGMHITLAEQLGSDRPQGIRDVYGKIVAKFGQPHEAEHKIMDCLGLILWEAQRQNRVPDEQAYLACLEKISE